MPDKYGFDHLPNWGTITHRCIEEGCDFEGSPLQESTRARHARQHERARKARAERTRNQNLAEGRKLKRMAEREDKQARGET